MDQWPVLDKQLFRVVNYDWHNSFFDWLMPLMRNAEMWYPFYLFLLLFVTINYGKKGWWWVLFFVFTVSTANFISSSIIKEHILRLRPCNDPSIAGWVRVLVGYRPQSSSFTSSHATNHFAMAVFIYATLKNAFGKKLLLIYLWAFMISFAQVYVGVHYPLDVTCGALIGILIGYLCGKLFNHQFSLALN
ncbi:MAG: phosphatase PAP2 family protein [Bacteroidetes bacterium]|nr:phosphatase PAP2 family protein [Bacteroidota bacterium]